jgi:hypothetical protein
MSKIETTLGPANSLLAYCDYLADRIQKGLREDSQRDQTLVGYVDRVEMDLHPDKGYFMSTKKTIRVQDTNGKWYRVTVEEAGCES